ncbi:MAG: AAA family ATPase [Candidatus Moranbacteria bacterium]|nr:AAA family ATPase [Candidatus Moranbacteria bacterium]
MSIKKEEERFEGIKQEALSEEDLNKSLKPISLNELFSMEFPENKWVIENLVPYQGITIISGAPASYKTWLILQMAIDIASGGSLLGQFKCEPLKVMIIDEENHLRLVQERLRLLGADAKLPICFLSQKGFLVSKKNMLEKVIEICKQDEIDVIFIDSLVRVNNAEENDASQMSEVFRQIKHFCQNGITVILTHHERKEGVIKISAQNRLRGSSDISAAVDAHLAIKRDKDDKSKIIIEQAKLRMAKEIESFEVAIREVEEKMEFSYLGQHSEEASKKETAKEIIKSVLEEEPDGLSRSELFQKVNELENIGDKSIREAIKELIASETILERQGSKNTKICSLPKFHQEESAIQEALI